MDDSATSLDRLDRYRPLFALVAVSLAVGCALALAGEGFSTRVFMHGAMGFSLCAFALLKLFDAERFADGFEMYDLIARRSRSYARAYPLLELGLGLAYFAQIAQVAVYAATIALFAIGSVGVIAALGRGLDIHCPCMGTVLDVPLSTVTLAEDLGMVLMAMMMLAVP